MGVTGEKFVMNSQAMTEISIPNYYRKQAPENTVYLRSDAAVAIYFAARFVRLLFEGGYYWRAAFISWESLETSTTTR